MSERKAEAKVWRGWCVYWPHGEPCIVTVGYLRADSLAKAKDRFLPSWRELRRRGFTVRRVTIKPEE